jgi:hypothetical protein
MLPLSLSLSDKAHCPILNLFVTSRPGGGSLLKKMSAFGVFFVEN